ncbi:hypothetical protein VVT58_16910 (plasmid) [Sphingobium sp. SJ10-10]|uniref:hypothetical protein n=1 Tax=Sphingobium sp. SJ10-10 TaxID=3114999 RepID=UPI002E18448D|nr:hypothetical protein [Sphingobium sp. SJ10-10]
MRSGCSGGDYGTGVDTNILVVPMSLRYNRGNLPLAATAMAAYHGSSAIVGDGSGGIVIDPNTPRITHSGSAWQARLK